MQKSKLPILSQLIKNFQSQCATYQPPLIVVLSTLISVPQLKELSAYSDTNPCFLSSVLNLEYVAGYGDPDRSRNGVSVFSELNAYSYSAFTLPNTLISSRKLALVV